MFILRNYMNNIRSTKVGWLFNLDQIWSMKDRDSETRFFSINTVKSDLDSDRWKIFEPERMISDDDIVNTEIIAKYRTELIKWFKKEKSWVGK